MNTGVISSRYARALLKYVQETGGGERVCAQVRAYLASPDTAPRKLEPELSKFIALLVSHGRMEYVRLIFTSFVRMYYASVGVKLAHLTTAVPAPDLADRLKGMVEQKYSCRLVLDTAVDPSIIGGFVFVIDDLRLDASVKRQISKIRREFVEKNRRIV